ncbi:MAG: phosphomannomutase/phosphoglucomutase [Congregibacter sp.]
MAKHENKKNLDSKSGSAPTDESSNSYGINGRGNALRDLAIQGLLIVLIPALASLAYLVLVRAPAEKAALIEHVANSYASQQAHTVAIHIDQLRERLASATASPIAMQAIADTAVSDGSAATRDLLRYFPDAMSLRLISLGELGTADLEDGRQGLRNHIEVDLVRRVSNGELAEPEAYQYQDVWLASLAQSATHPQLPGQSAVLLVTLDAAALTSLMRYPGDMPGKFALEQRVFGNASAKSQTIVSLGSGSGPYQAAADVENAPWRILFTPSDMLVANVTKNVTPDYDVLGLVGLCSLVALALMMLRSSAVLARESSRIVDAAEHRTAMDVRVPQLLALARNLRVQTLRRNLSSVAGGGNSRTTTPVIAPTHSSPGSAEPMTAVDGPADHQLPPSIFRAYDIRGIAESDLTDDTVYRIGSAIGTIADEMGEQTLAVGCDGRTSSRRIKDVLVRALMQSGRDVVDIGLVPTPLLYFATNQLETPSGVMITGSHNPPDHNGMKIVLKGKTVAEGTIEKIYTLAQQGRFSKGSGRQIQKDLAGDYLDEVVSDIAIAVPLKIVVDAGNGATSGIAPELLTELGLDVIPLYCEIDGSFPNRSPDTGKDENLSALVGEVLATGADFGVAYDGDGDRVVVVTGSGRIVRTDTLMMVFARDVVSRNPGADVVYDVKCSRNLATLITSLGGRPVLWKTGHAHMKAKMVETGALLGGEFSGHIFFGERWYGFDDGMYATGRLAEILSSQDASLDEILADLPQDVSTPEILVPIADDEKFEVMQRFVEEAQFTEGKSNKLDGLRVDFQEGWGLLRASNTGPALTARFEGKDKATLAAIQQQFREQLNAIAPELTVPF